MKNQISISHKIGYLRPKSGRYEFAEIVNISADEFTLINFIKVGKGKKTPNIWKEKINKVLEYLKTPSQDFKDGRTLLKHKPVKCNFMTEGAQAYNNSLKQ